MKRFLPILVSGLLAAGAASAAPGDTTWVQAHNDMQLDHYGNFDVPVQFPNGSTSYRKIIMTVTIGKYQCPGNPQYCGDWDYTVLNYLMTPGGDTLELGRLITPYANAGSPRTPWGWKQRYEYDVTDFYPLLKDAGAVRLHYSGYSWGFTGNIKFAFIEGTPPRNVVGIERLWHGSFPYGKPSDPISNYMPAMSKTAPAGAQSAEMKFTITGHGADDLGCSEFCEKFYEVKVNGNFKEQKTIWRDNCGSNHIYPQSGTWIYNRGNWCPGDLINPNVHTLGVTGGASYSVGVDLEQYTGSTSIQGTSQGSYIIESGVWYYGAPNRSVDASLDDIIAPSDHEVHFRQNPTNGHPIVKVKNTGSTAITSLKFEYGIDGLSSMQYTWNGSLSSLKEQQIELPVMKDLFTYSGAGKFTIKILEANGQADGDNTNDKLTSSFVAAPLWSTKFNITMRTNNFPETDWRIYSSDNKIVKERIGSNTKFRYVDTVELGPGAYRLEVIDNACDGLSWWANSGQKGTGNMSVNPASGAAYKLNGYFGGDFGCGFTQYFNVNWPQAVEEVKAITAAIDVYPNPAGSQLQISLKGINVMSGALYLLDAAGRVVLQQMATGTEEKIDVSALSNGMYTVVYADNNTSVKARVIVAK